MRAPAGRIFAPAFPDGARWLNVATLRMDQQAGRPVVVEFFDVAGVASMRTLPYLKAWHERYARDGLRVVSVHVPGREISRDADAVAHAVRRLGIRHPVMLDHEGELWSRYGNEGWPARYLWDPNQTLVDLHYGEGAYADGEALIQSLLGVERELLAPLHPEDDPGVQIVVPTHAQSGPYSGPYAAGAVWVVASGHGPIGIDGRTASIDGVGAYELIAHAVHTEATLDLVVSPQVTVHETVFTPGLVSPEP